MENKNRIYEAISFAIFLVFIGTLLLLANLGYISLTTVFFLFFRFWPLFIILLGIKIVIGAFSLGKLFNLILDIIIDVAIVLALVYFNGRSDSLLGNNNVYEDIKDMNISTEYAKDVTNREFTFEVGGAAFDMKDKGTLPLEVKGNQIVGKPELTTKIENGKLVSNFKSDTQNVYIWRIGHEQKFNFDLGQDNLPLSLIIKLGAGQGNITLSDTDLKKLKAEVGAGELIFDLRGKQLFADADINVGAGNVVIRMDKNTNLSVKYSIGAGRLSVVNDSKNIHKEFGGLGGKGFYTVSDDPNVSIKNSLFEVSIGAGNVEIIME